MGQTLTHGVYLPDEGERNCYAGLAANWQILDTSVGTIAAHTAALAGKAPLAHTHTVSQITDFPAYGNAAGTICEGNDSRLSDARTPVAHTHTKSDVTDLLNSNFIPSANNSYNLGSSSYQWNNLYAKNYYYNGVAWGLDKANTWTGNNTFTSTITTKTNVDRTVAPSADSIYGTIICRDKNNSAMFRMQGTIKTDLSNVWDMMLVAPNASYITFFKYTINSATLTKELRLKADSVIPDVNSENLGTTDKPWKTLNGINPGALSLPDRSASFNLDTTNWDKRAANNGTICSITASLDGWLCIQITRDIDFSVWAIGSYRQLFRAGQLPSGGKYAVIILFPLDKNHAVNLYTLPLDTSESDLIFNVYRFFPCIGNV